MNQPTAQTFRTLVVGWLLAPRRAVMGMVRASGTERHHAAFHRIFATAKWSVDHVGLRLFDVITAGNSEVFLSVDDTLLPRTGLKVFGTGMHRDPLLSSRGFHVTRWGHCWVVLCVVIESRRFPGKRFALPVLLRLYLNKSSAKKWRRTYRKKNDLLIEMLKILERHVAESRKTRHLLGDSAFTARNMLHEIPASAEVIGRLATDARLHEPAPKRQPGLVGRPRKRGARLPSPLELITQKGLRRLKLALYESSTQHVRLAISDAYLNTAPDRLVRIVVIEHLTGGRGITVFYSTLWTRLPNRFSHSIRGGRTTKATGFLLYTLIVWWHETACAKPDRPLRIWKNKSRISFADILGVLRRQTLQIQSQTNLSTPDLPPGVKKYVDHFTRLIAPAA